MKNLKLTDTVNEVIDTDKESESSIEKHEDEDDFESTPENQPVQEEDPYAWAKQRTVVQEQNAAVQQSDTNQPVVQADAHPGWRWDETIQQWVPDPSTMPKQ